MGEEFSALVRVFRERAGRSRNDLAHEVGVDPSYLTRIEHGDREPPRQAVVEQIATALRLSMMERNRLLASGGYVPLSITQLGAWDETLQAVVDVLTDRRITAEQQERFRLVVQLLCAQWRPDADVAPDLTS